MLSTEKEIINGFMMEISKIVTNSKWVNSERLSSSAHIADIK